MPNPPHTGRAAVGRAGRGAMVDALMDAAVDAAVDATVGPPVRTLPAIRPRPRSAKGPEGAG